MTERHPLSAGGNTLVILDTCVLLPSRLSDVLFDLMLEGLYFAYWTGDVEAEFLRNWPQVHPDASKSGAKRLKAFQQATNNGHLITGYDDAAFMDCVPARVHENDRHLIAAALVMVNGLDEEDDSALHKVMIVSDNTKHLAVADTRKLGIEVIKAGVFVDRLFDAAPARVSQAIVKSLSDLTKPPYTVAELVAALRLHGAKSTAVGLKKVAG
ncbi:hypothetical protein [Rhodoferax sp.]|uniref:hypothetical protein n=1 Tax=Rhodoferax sp. TaxID=50421 RepID=UPI002608746B|nr:hypothetical protein [Rhodoferax sp.]MDD2810668.1 hypothetical protein [Rhodoferax sp.]MDD4944324.1 hypothetical protein [Rhodoferax sp.]MDD5479604.1 hypothetical protein [Rhodoferax sp.]